MGGLFYFSGARLGSTWVKQIRSVAVLCDCPYASPFSPLALVTYLASALKTCSAPRSPLRTGLALVTYLTSALKDLLCSPRPLHVATPTQRQQLLPSAGDPGRSFTEY